MSRERRRPEPVLVLAGPTASGKSALALALAKRLDGVVINADSMQLYRELRVLTARPTDAALARAPHRLYGTLAAADPCSAGRWRGMAATEIADAHAAGRLPIVTGGTGLYLKSLTGGLARIPTIHPEVRARVRAALAAEGAPALHAALARRDPAGAAALEPTDGQRIARALEVLEATGRPLAAWQREPADGAPPGWRFATVLLAPPREALTRACDARFLAMLADGALEEARAVAALGLAPDLPATKALGLRPLIAHLSGNLSLAAATALAQRDTRRYARRQMTWFRHQMAPELRLKAQYSESLLPRIFSFISEYRLTVPG